VDDGIAVTMRGKSIGHLWFLLALLGITTLVALFRKVLPRTRHLSSLTLASAAFAGVTISIGCATLMRDWVAGSELPLSATFNSMIWGISYGLPYFLIGMVMVKRHDVVEILTPTSPVTFLIIAVLTIAYVAFMPLEVDTLASTIAAGLLAIPLTTSLLLACSKYLSFQSDKIDLMAKSSFTVYLVHHPIIVILGVLSANLALPWYIHYAGICILTWVMSFGIWYAVRDIPVANVLFGAKSLARKNVSFRWRKEPRQSKEAAWPISSGHGTIA
jgi:glucan biosynthesis protein C